MIKEIVLWGFLILRLAYSLRSFDFIDNELPVRFGPENGYMTYNTGKPVPNELSFCLWIFAKFDRFGDQIPIIEFYKDGELNVDPFISSLYRKDKIQLFTSRDFRKKKSKLNQKWTHICSAMDIENDIMKMYLNGEDIPVRSNIGPIHTRLTNNNFSMIVRIGHYYFDNKPLLGKIADIQVWDKMLSKEETESFSRCSPVQDQLIGSIVNAKTEWNITGTLIEEVNITITELECSMYKTKPTLFVPVRFQSVSEALQTCDKFLPGSMADNFQNIDEYKQYHDEGNANPATIKECWTGGRLLHWLPYQSNVSKKPQKKDFYHFYSEDQLKVDAWRSSQPNDKQGQACIKAYLGMEYRDSWYDFACSDDNLEKAACTACKIPRSLDKYVSIKLRGLCRKTHFDTIFEVMNDEEGYVSYVGDKTTTIKYDPKVRKWIMAAVNRPLLTAESNASKASLAMGSHYWTIRNDFDCSTAEETQLLTLSACKDSEFTCENGLCINIEKRCDRSPNCDDKSDELGCRKISINKSYQKFITPPVLGKTDTKIKIEISVDIIDILEINEISSLFQVQFYLHLSWFDSRLTYFDLRNDSGLNTLSPIEKQEIWFPVLVFDNTEHKLSTLVDYDASINVQKTGSYFLSDASDPTNRQKYSGKENPITLSRFYNIRFLCAYNMQWYPFDIQKCHLNFLMKGKSGDNAELVTKLLQFLGEKGRNEYVVEKFFMNTSEEYGKTGVQIQILLGRKLIPIILHTYIPTILITVISHATNYFKAFFFEAQVTVNLTTLLVMVTLFVNFSNELPPSSYIKMIDVYLIFCLLVPFTEVLLHTYMDRLRMDSGSDPIGDAQNNSNDKKGREINHHGKLIKVGEDRLSTEFRRSEGFGFDMIFGLSSSLQHSPRGKKTATVEDILAAENINPAHLISRNEKVEIEAFEKLYSHVNKNSRVLIFCEFMAHYGIPVMIVSFHAAYWFTGIYHVSEFI